MASTTTPPRPRALPFSLCIALLAALSARAGVTLFQDNFNDNSIDPAKWTTAGNTVVEEGGMLKVEVNATDNGGIATSVPFNLANTTGLITMVRHVRVHHNYGTGTRYLRKKHHFRDENGDPSAQILYWDYHYQVDQEGFGWHGEHPTLYDTWFEEVLTYDPVTGDTTYVIDGGDTYQARGNPHDGPTIQLRWYDLDWFTGHYVHVDDVVVTQEIPEPTSLGLLLLGALAFLGRRRP